MSFNIYETRSNLSIFNNSVVDEYTSNITPMLPSSYTNSYITQTPTSTPTDEKNILTTSFDEKYMQTVLSSSINPYYGTSDNVPIYNLNSEIINIPQDIPQDILKKLL